MSNNNVLYQLRTAFPEIEFSVSGEGCHFTVQAVGDIFEGMSRLKRQQMLNQELKSLIDSGEIHAVQYKIFTQAELAKVQGKE